MAPKITLTPQQKLDKQKRDNLKFLHNRILSAHNFKEIQTWNDVEKFTPLNSSVSDKSQPITFAELKAFLQKQSDELEHILSRQTIKEKHQESPEISEQGREKITETDKQLRDDKTPTLSPTIQPEHKVPELSKTDELTERNDYGYVRSPNVVPHFFPYWFQKKCTTELLEGITKHKRRGQLLLASTGTGKTFMSGDLVRHLEDIQFSEDKTMSHIPYLYVTRATIVEQTKRVFKNFFKLTAAELEIINIDALRSSAGRLWVTEKMQIINGEEEYFWEWKKHINPCVILWDECQALKNAGSAQHQIASAFNDLPTKETYQIFISATPFTRVIEAKCFAVSTHKRIDHLGFPPGTLLTNETWPSYAAAIAYPAKPDEYNEQAVSRLMKDLDEYVIRVKGVRPQFKAINNVESINFETKEEREYYEKAWERYLREKAKEDALAMAQGKDRANGVNMLVAFLKFRMAAEYCRRYHLARRMWENVNRKNKAAICAINFKSTLISVVQILVNDYGVSRDNISLVWGGGQTQLTNKQKTKQKIIQLKDKLEASGTSVEEMLKDMDLEDVEDRLIQELDPSLRLGLQSHDDRQREIDKFQSGKSLYCLYTFRAGGVGLSLHHSDELTTDWDRQHPKFNEWYSRMLLLPEKHSDPEKQRPYPGKVRRKLSGYAVEEDIPFIPVRSRKVDLGITYSDIELVQGFGRAPRLTSLSDTEQTLLSYDGTIEVDVKAIVRTKLGCLKEVVRMHEDWQDICNASNNERKELVKKYVNSVPTDVSGISDNELITDELESEDEE